MSLKDRLFLIERGEYSPISAYQKETIFQYLDQCKNIPNIDFRKIDYYVCDELSDREINAAFVPYKPDCIFLKSISNPFNNIPAKLKVSLTKAALDKVRESYKENIKAVVPYVGHEMCHMEQFHRQGRFIYAINSTSLLYPIMLDKKAFAIEESFAFDLNLNPLLYGDKG